MADRIFLFLGGKIAQQGVARDFYTRPATLSIARFFGTQNLISGTVNGDRFHASFGSISLPERFAFKKGILMIRQEAIEVGQGTNNSYSGTVEAVEYLGTHSLVVARAGEDRLTLNVPPYLTVDLGSVIHIMLPVEHLWVVEDVS